MVLDQVEFRIDKKRIISKEDMYLDGKFIGPQRKHSWLFDEVFHEITRDDIKCLEEEHCLALNIDNEFVCFIYLRKKDEN